MLEVVTRDIDIIRVLMSFLVSVLNIYHIFMIGLLFFVSQYITIEQNLVMHLNGFVKTKTDGDQR